MGGREGGRRAEGREGEREGVQRERKRERSKEGGRDGGRSARENANKKAKHKARQSETERSTALEQRRPPGRVLGLHVASGCRNGRRRASAQGQRCRKCKCRGDLFKQKNNGA